VSVGDPLEKGDASPQPGPEDLEELLAPSPTAELGNGKPLVVEELVARLLAEDEARSREATEEEVDDGLRVLHDHGAPDDDVKEVEHLSKEVTQAGTGVDSLAVNEGVELSVVVHLVGMAEGTGRDLGDVLGVTQHPVEVKY
jgi:hypothetical protein